MFMKDLSLVFLLDFYGDMLPERQKNILYSYYENDLSLAEIAETEGISRQGIRHLLKKGEEQLRFAEEKLGLAARYEKEKEAVSALISAVSRLPVGEDPVYADVRKAANDCETLILGKEETD